MVGFVPGTYMSLLQVTIADGLSTCATMVISGISAGEAIHPWSLSQPKPQQLAFWHELSPDTLSGLSEICRVRINLDYIEGACAIWSIKLLKSCVVYLTGHWWRCY